MPAVLLDIHDNIARITLNRPEVYNAVNLDLVSELAAVALRCEVDKDIRAVIITGAGKVFCAGGDLKDFASRFDEIDVYLQDVTTNLHTAISRFARMSAPVIAAVHGSAAGGGMSLACACDLIIAADTAKFTMAYTKIGLVPDGSGSYYLPRLVGLKRALDLILTNRVLTAHEAEEWGMVSRVVPEAELSTSAEALARILAAGPTEAFGISKRLLHGSWNESLETQMALETRAIAERSRSADAREGITAFVEKRTPTFRGD